MGKKRVLKRVNKKPVVKEKSIDKTIIGGQITGINVRAFEIRNASLFDCEIFASKIFHSSLKKCKVFNSEIDASNIFDSKLHEVKLAGCGTVCCKISTASLALRRFPPEIRRMILDLCINPDFGITPPVVIALRGEPQLYGEALETWDKKCVVLLYPAIYKDFKKLPKVRRKAIKAVRL
jgi:hypothetical protein